MFPIGYSDNPRLSGAPMCERWRERLLVADLIVTLNRFLIEAVPPDTSAPLEVQYVLCVVYIGTFTKRPLTPYKISQLTGMPRTSVINRLNWLERHKIVERHGRAYTLTPVRASRAHPRLNGAVTAIKRAAAALSMVDTQPVDRGG